ncbi:hypothetical protein [Rhodocaloribacter sp.]
MNAAAPSPRRAAWLLGFGVAATLLAGCLPSRPAERPPDDQFGNRVEGQGPDGRRTVVITPPDSARTYLYYPAVYDTVHVRPALPTDAHTPVPVEVLVKGAFPDACMELHDVTQKRSGHLIEVTLTMRKPEGAVCASVLRPYRFYLTLEGTYEPGNYTLKLNGRTHPFVVRAPETENQ